MKKNRNSLFALLMFFLTFLTLSSFISMNLTLIPNTNKNNNVLTSNLFNFDLNTKDYQEYNQWIKNPHFNPPISPNWTHTKSGDLTDLELSKGSGHIDYTVIGDNGSLTYNYTPPTQSDWIMMRNPDLPLFPNDTNSNGWIGFDAAGIFTNHTWDEVAGDAVGQNPSILYKRNESLPLNLTDYRVTSASLRSIVNFSADGVVESPGESPPQGGYTFDYVRTYVKISDINETRTYELAQYKYRGNSTLNDTLMNVVPEDVLVFYLNNIFEMGTSFTITLGINFFCEDNEWLDIDIWHYVRIKSLNLSFTYEKIIDQNTRGFWGQTGNNFTAGAGLFEINDAKFNFKYKLNSTWPGASPNAEIIIKVDNNTLSQTLKLISTGTTYKEAKIGGFDVATLLVKNKNISISLELFLADNFDLTNNITLSIDDVTLNTTVTILEERTVGSVPPFIFPTGKDWSWLIYLLSVILSVVISMHLIYFKYLRYPSMVRKIRKLKRNVKKEKVEKPVQVKNRAKLIESNLKRNLKTVNVQYSPPYANPPPQSKPAGGSLKLLLLCLAFFLITLFSVISLSVSSFSINPNLLFYLEKLNSFQNSNFQIQTQDYQKTNQWIKNPLFNPPINQYWSSSKSGDLSDIDMTEDIGYVNYVIIGDNGTQNYSYNPPQVNDWKMMRDPDYAAFPNDTVAATGENAWCWIDNEGAFLNHTWHEEAGDEVGQVSGALWKQNKTMPVNMSDYKIISASVSALVNASPSSNIEKPGEGPGAQYRGSGDYVKFFIRISDLSGNLTYTIASYKYSNDTDLSDTLMFNISEIDLKFYLTSVLQNDGYNFTIIMGINVWSEDNDVTDSDDWYYIRIKSLNLSFSYQKAINQFTVGQWSQTGDKLESASQEVSANDLYLRTSANDFIINEAKLYFQYKIDKNWTTDSPNSEIRFIINNVTYYESIKLSTANSTFQNARTYGFDVTNLMVKNENISITIEVYIADNFYMSKNTTISIDNVSLFITRTFIVIPNTYPLLLLLPRNNPPLMLYILGLVIVLLVASFVAYQQFFRTPPPVRKIRRLKKQIQKNKADKPVSVKNRDDLVQKQFENKLRAIPIQKVQEIDTSKLLLSEITNKIDGITTAKLNELDTSGLLTDEKKNQIKDILTAKLLALDSPEKLTDETINNIAGTIISNLLGIGSSKLITQEQINQSADLAIAKVLQLDTSELLVEEIDNKIKNSVASKINDIDVSSLLPEETKGKIADVITTRLLQLDSPELLTEEKINKITDEVVAMVLQIKTPEVITVGLLTNIANNVTAKVLQLDTSELLVEEHITETKVKGLIDAKINELDTSELLTEEAKKYIRDIVATKLMQLDTSELITEETINNVAGIVTAKLLELDTSELLTSETVNVITNIVTAKVLELDTSELLTEETMNQISSEIQSQLSKEKIPELEPNLYKLDKFKIKSAKKKTLLDSSRIFERFSLNEVAVSYYFKINKSISEVLIKEFIPKNLKIEYVIPSSLTRTQIKEKGKIVQVWKIIPEPHRDVFEFGYVCSGKEVQTKFPFELTIPGKNLKPKKPKSKDLKNECIFVPEFHQNLKKYKKNES
ncbi:MAG: hypothetical protein ACTSRG_04490 [Candidatus Helarchaeota archaeon]